MASEATKDEAIKFLECAVRNWSHVPRLSNDDIDDVRVALNSFRRAAVAELVEALRPFVDLGPQKGAWGVISKKLNDFAPMTVTVTKAQMLAACNAVHRHQAGPKGDDRGRS